MSEIAEKPVSTFSSPLERICYNAPWAQCHEIQMQNQFLLLGVTWLPPALAMAELERLLNRYDTDRKHMLENVLETAHSHYLDIHGLLKREETNARVSQPQPRLYEAHQCVRFMSVRYNLAVELCAAYVCWKV